MINDALVTYLATGQIQVKPDIERITEKGKYQFAQWILFAQ